MTTWIIIGVLKIVEKWLTTQLMVLINEYFNSDMEIVLVPKYAGCKTVISL